MGLRVRMLVGLDWLALGEPSPGSNAQGHLTRRLGGGGGTIPLGVSITGVVIEWTSPLVCLPIYTQKVGRRLCLCLCAACLTSVTEVPGACRQVQCEKPFSGAPAVHS